MNPPADLPLWLDAIAAALLVVGAMFGLLGSFALVRLRDFYKRLHGPTKASTLGVGCVAIASALVYAASGPASVHEVLLALFIFLTAPIAAHLLVKAALHLARRDQAPPP
jgi:multicomponent K+:H+ antiporter subunit G